MIIGDVVHVFMSSFSEAADVTFTFIHLADAFIQSDLQLRNTITNTL